MVGYRFCACGGCFEIVIGDGTDLCDDCEEAGCQPATENLTGGCLALLDEEERELYERDRC